jgi:hypothetical protein
MFLLRGQFDSINKAIFSSLLFLSQWIDDHLHLFFFSFFLFFFVWGHELFSVEV